MCVALFACACLLLFVGVLLCVVCCLWFADCKLGCGLLLVMCGFLLFVLSVCCVFVFYMLAVCCCVCGV